VCESGIIYLHSNPLQFFQLFKYTFVPSFDTCGISCFLCGLAENTCDIHTKRFTTLAHDRAGITPEISFIVFRL
jgi:hypothetical protein